MDFGLDKFFEMFQARFGRLPTNILLSVIGLTVLLWGIKTTTEYAVYLYGMIKSADFIPVLESEHAATHLVIFAVQIAITFVILAFIWRWFYRHRLNAITKRFDDYKAEWAVWEKKLEGVKAEHRRFMQVFDTFKDAFEKTKVATEVVRDQIVKTLAENPQLRGNPADPAGRETQVTESGGTGSGDSRAPE
jgi:hypothetical protein